MKFSKVKGFGSCIAFLIEYGFFTICFITLTIVGFGYGLWIPASVVLLLALFFLGTYSYFIYLINKAFKPFRKKGGEIIKVKIINPNLGGWFAIINKEVTAEYQDTKIKAKLVFSWTSSNIKENDEVNCYHINDQYLLIK